jgi:two-component system sensor histidine kinase BaeS
MSQTSTATQPAPTQARRFDRLRVKLFLAIAGTNALVALIAYLVFSWSFDRGFIDYIHRGDIAKLDPLASELAQEYARAGSWDALVSDPEGWAERTRAALGLPPRPSGEMPRTSDAGSAQREFPLTIDPRLMLFDARGELLIGRPERAGEAERKPIVVQGRTVGELGYVKRQWLFESVARLASVQTHGSFAAIGLGMLGAALLLGAGLAHWLTRRIRTVAQGTTALIQGDYDVRLAARGHDELAQLARDFNKLAATLAATRRARSQWVVDIAHELRTPLSVLQGEIEALQDGVRPLNAAGIASLGHEVEHLNRLVGDLHLLSMSDLGALTYHPEPTDMAELLRDVFASQQRALDERDLQVTADLQSACVLGDAARLEQVFNNLMQNTLRYTDAGGRLRVAARRSGERVVVEWEDSAPGVAAADLPHLTDRLYRVDTSRSRAGGGSGLGLAIAKAIVDGHHGTMTAHPSPLGGLAWTLEFPAHD